MHQHRNERTRCATTALRQRIDEALEATFGPLRPIADGGRDENRAGHLERRGPSRSPTRPTSDEPSSANFFILRQKEQQIAETHTRARFPWLPVFSSSPSASNEAWKLRFDLVAAG